MKHLFQCSCLMGGDTINEPIESEEIGQMVGPVSGALFKIGDCDELYEEQESKD